MSYPAEGSLPIDRHQWQRYPNCANSPMNLLAESLNRQIEAMPHRYHWFQLLEEEVDQTILARDRN